MTINDYKEELRKIKARAKQTIIADRLTVLELKNISLKKTIAELIDRVESLEESKDFYKIN